jgi:flavin-dependent dehydrogenase
LDDPNHGISYGVRSSWGAPSFAERDYMFTMQGHGVNLQREVFDDALAQRAAAAGATLRFDTKLIGLSQTGDNYTASLRHGDLKLQITADIIIDASGRHAKAARQVGAILKRSDQMIGILGRVTDCDAGHAVGQLLIEAVPDGWLYGVTFEGGLGLCAFMTDAHLLSATKDSAHQTWQDRIVNSKGFADLFGSATLPKVVDVFDAASQCIAGLHANTCIAVGDAAAAYDPLSSWGIIKGVSDGFEGGIALQRETAGQYGAIQAHRRKQAADYTSYLDKRSAFYGAENRWHDAPFWRARQEISVSS